MNVVKTLLLVACLAGGAPGQGRDRGPRGTPPSTRTVGPLQGPSEHYADADWRFWFHIARDRLVHAKLALHRPAGRSDFCRIPDPRIPQVVQALEEIVRGSSDELQGEGLMALAKLGQAGRTRGIDAASSVDLLVELGLGAASRTVRVRSILGLGVLGEAGGVLPLFETLSSSSASAEEREYAGLALGMMEHADADLVLHELLQPKGFATLDPIARRGVAWGVSLHPVPSLRTDIHVALRQLATRRSRRGSGGVSQENALIRSALLLGLARLRDVRDEETFVEYLDHADTHLRRVAIMAVGMLHEGSGSEDAVERLWKRVSRDNKRNKELEASVADRCMAYLAIGRIGGERAATLLARRLGNPRTERHSIDPEELFALFGIALSGHQNKKVLARVALEWKRQRHERARAAVALCLGLHQPPLGAKPVYEELRPQGDDGPMQGYFALAAGLIGEQRSVSKLRQMLARRTERECLPEVSLALLLLGDQETAVEILHRRLGKEKNDDVRRTLCASLGLVGDRQSWAVLLEIAKDAVETPSTRANAVAALGMLADPGSMRRLASALENFDLPGRPEYWETLSLVR